ncbi:MAG TPA: hypothetical protein VJR48_07765 [Ktedonobacterales bacterium]|nr:hypothetical protein [Ktedonobacterales bacterium]
MVNAFRQHLILSGPSYRVPVYILVDITPAILTLAADLCNKYWEMDPHPLRSLEAIQLASAIAAAASTTDELIFVTADTRLAAVASFEGFRVVNPAYPPKA